MKITRIGLLLLALSVFTFSCFGISVEKGVSDSSQEDILEIEGLKFNESTYPYDGGLLVASFGSSELNPLNGEGKGYISYYKNGETTVLIDANGDLDAPKGMVERDGLLYICDVNRVVVYDLNCLTAKPKVIKFGQGELFLNDIICFDEDLFVSVTNTGNIYKVDLNSCETATVAEPALWCNVVGANGLVVDGDKMFVASYPADGVTTQENVVYVIDEISSPKPQKLVLRAGQYDGLALSSGGEWLYASNWSPAEIVAINLLTKEVKVVPIATKMVGPADITIVDDRLYIPDLVNSHVIMKVISK